MFLTPQLVLILIVIKFVAGCLIGVATLAVRRRSQFRLRSAFLGATVAGVVFLFLSGAGGWADSHAAFVNGKRADFSPGGEDLRFRNLLAENELVFASVGSAAAAMLVGGISQKSDSLKITQSAV